MNRMILGAVAALLLAAAGLFWWQGRAELESRAPPLAANARGSGPPIELPGSNTDGRRGPGLPSVPGHEKAKASKQERRFNRYDKNRDGVITRNEMMVTRVKAFQKLDTNHDNLLTFEEWAVKTSNRFKEIDRNGDGVISRAELDAYYAAKDAKASKPRCSCSRIPRGSPAAPQGEGAEETTEPGEAAN